MQPLRWVRGNPLTLGSSSGFLVSVDGIKKSSRYWKNVLRCHPPPPLSQTYSPLHRPTFTIKTVAGCFPMPGTPSQSGTIIVSKLCSEHRIGGGTFDVDTTAPPPNHPLCPTSRRCLTCRIIRTVISILSAQKINSPTGAQFVPAVKCSILPRWPI